MSQQPSPALVPGDLVVGRSFTFGQIGGVVHAALTLDRGGRIGGSRHPNETAWRVDDRGDVLFLDDAGRVTTRFHEVAVPNGQIVLLGEFLETGTVHFLSAPAVEGDPAPPSPRDAGHEPPDVGVLTAPVWGLGRLGGGVVTDLFILPDGRLQGAGGPNEAGWTLGDDGSLLFFGADGEMTTTFTTRVRTTRGDVWLGPFVDGHTIHFLRPTVDPRHPEWLPPFAASLMEQQRAVSDPWGPLRPHLLAPDRYIGARRHLFSLATGEVLGTDVEPSTARRDGDGEGDHGDDHPAVDDVSGRIDEIRQVFDEVVAEFALDPRALFWFSIKGSDAVALYEYVLANRPRRCLQIGTFAGFSALLIADALRAAGGGQVTAIDPEIPHENVMTPVDVAREVAARLDLEDQCRFERGWGSTMIGLPPYEHWKHTLPLVGQSLLSEMGGVDLVFIDADHSVTATIADFMLVKDFVTEGGSVFFHDVFNWSSVTEAVEIILNDIHYDRGTHQLWQFDVNCGPDGLAALRRRPTPPSPALTVTVVDAANGRPVPGADVTAIGFDTAATSSRGEVVFFREMPAGTSVEVRAAGRRPERVRLDRATDGRAVTLAVALPPGGDGTTGAAPPR